MNSNIFLDKGIILSSGEISKVHNGGFAYA